MSDRASDDLHEEVVALREQVRRLTARRDRERAARIEAETILEERGRELYTANLDLRAARDNLEKRITRRTEELRVANARLLSALDTARAATRARENFLATISHELRTPMNAILGMSELLVDAGLPDETGEMAETILLASKSLIRHLNQVLDFAAVNAGHFSITSMPFSPRRLTEHLGALFSAPAQHKGVELIVTVDHEVPDGIEGDEQRIEQIIGNLLGNAVKFTREGSVALRLGLDGEDVVWTIADTGVGMSQEALTRVFKPFEQAGPDTRNEFGGTGLGLAISHQLAELMKGALLVESELGVGTTFTFRMPARRTLALSNNPEEEETGTLSLRVLVVDDNPVNLLVAQKLLERLGCTAHTVGSGQESIDFLAEHHVDVVLMDLHMRDMEGTEAARRIRISQDVLDPDTPILACTADARSDVASSCIESGMNGIMVKPIQLNSLHRSLSDAVRARLS